VVVFSVSCGESARVAGKGLSEGELRVDSSKLKGIARELNTETRSAQRSEEERTGTYFLSPPLQKQYKYNIFVLVVKCNLVSGLSA
jgi:hypothetical protein